MCIHSRAGTAEQLESSVRQEGNNLSLNSRAAALLPDVYKLLLKTGNAATFAATGSCCCRFSVISLQTKQTLSVRFMTVSDFVSHGVNVT